MKKRLAIISTHPIQYNAPLFALLNERGLVDFKVFYTWGDSVLENKYDPGFGKIINWDIDLLKGYQYEFVNNVAKEKGSHHFKGIDNPELIEKIKQFDPGVILVYGWPFKSHLKLMRYFKGKVKIAFRGDSTLLDDTNNLKSKLRHLFLSWVYKHIDAAFYVGKSNMDYFLKMGLQTEQLIWAPHAIDNDRFDKTNQDNKINADALRSSLQIGEKDLVFLFAGKFEEKKDPRGLLNAFIKIGRAHV